MTGLVDEHGPTRTNTDSRGQAGGYRGHGILAGRCRDASAKKSPVPKHRANISTSDSEPRAAIVPDFSSATPKGPRTSK